MTTAVEVLDTRTGELVPVPPQPPQRGDTFSVLESAVRLADVICDTEMVPTVLRGRPDAIAAVVLFGYELGLGAMQSLQTIDLIQGRPALSPEGMRALVLSKGHGLIVDSTDEFCTIKCHRLEWPPDQPWVLFTFTLADAKRAGLLGKGSWNQYPRAMLMARATGEACRATFSDVISGLSYTPEEVANMGTPPPPPDSRLSTPPARPAETTERPAEATDPPADPTEPEPPAEPTEPPAAAPEAVPGADALEKRLNRNSGALRKAFRAWLDTRKLAYPPDSAENLALMEAEVKVLEAEAKAERDAYGR